MRIQSVLAKPLEGPKLPTLPQGPNKGDDFAQQLMDVMKEVNSAQINAREMKTDLMTGRPVEFHDVMISMERASIAMDLTLQVRNKMLEAYQEVMRTQI
jgi:flagellar hook-basal body complex protein FliE